MYLRDLVFNVLLISIVRFSTALPPIYPPPPERLLILRLLPEQLRVVHSIPDRWRVMQPPFRAPQMEIQMMKGEVSPDENWMFTNEYKYSGRDYESPTTRTSNKKVLQIGNVKENGNEKSNNADAQENIPLPDNWVPPIGSRNVITGPDYCDRGQRKDRNGKCRGVVPSHDGVE